MKNKILLFLFLTCNLYACNSQSETLDLSSGFAAFVVKDINSSIDWYSSKLNFKLVNQTHLEERGIKQANLKLGNTKIELIESKSSINPTQSNTKKGLILGIFKVGFITSSFDNWSKHLIELEMITEKDIVINPIDNKRMLIIKDPDGNRIQLFEK
ncbi:VOC family protein [Pontimicrobium aquaticum]|uniref:VOC family protein n=1 Tax=Pontimicrobium aquaticum TaxID=2565367 RepID=A0A4U0EVY5_9FLAO|nr:VOC family protein [Pontimicrobium aquaticum]TJY36055.1 VOC family protein [Pontimicrobium aquaticum]